MKTHQIPVENAKTPAEREVARLEELDEHWTKVIGVEYIEISRVHTAEETARTREQLRARGYEGLEVIVSTRHKRPVTAEMLEESERREREQAIAAGRFESYRRVVDLCARITRGEARNG